MKRYARQAKFVEQEDTEAQAGCLSVANHRQIGSLQVLLWVTWTFAVLATGLVQWHHAVLAHQPINVLGSILHCTAVGAVGFVVITLIEFGFESWRFLS